MTNLNKDQLNFENAEKTIEKNIFEIEKKTGEFLNDIYLMVETHESISINLSSIKDNEGKKIEKKYDLTKPIGDLGRAADCSFAEEILGWKPKISLDDGLRRTYEWAEQFLKTKNS